VSTPRGDLLWEGGRSHSFGSLRGGPQGLGLLREASAQKLTSEFLPSKTSELSGGGSVHAERQVSGQHHERARGAGSRGLEPPSSGWVK
jgi:hypothetical protein